MHFETEDILFIYFPNSKFTNRTIIRGLFVILFLLFICNFNAFLNIVDKILLPRLKIVALNKYSKIKFSLSFRAVFIRRTCNIIEGFYRPCPQALTLWVANILGRTTNYKHFLITPSPVIIHSRGYNHVKTACSDWRLQLTSKFPFLAKCCRW